MFLFCSLTIPSIAEFEAEQDAVPDNCIAIERREARPYVTGPARPKRQPLVTGDLPWRAPNPVGSAPRGDPPGGASRRSAPDPNKSLIYKYKSFDIAVYPTMYPCLNLPLGPPFRWKAG